MTSPLLDVQNLRKSFGALRASDGVQFSVRAGELHAVIGPNGAGKTTLISQLAGEILPDSGSIHFGGEEVSRLPAHARAQRGLARSFQITSLFPRFTALQNVALAVQARQGHSFRFGRPAWEDPAILAPAEATLARVGLAQQAGRSVGDLAHGQKRQVEIAVALATQPSLLLLDEPTAGMGREETQSMTGLLADLKSETTILLVEHDMDVVFSLADRITVLVYGRAIATGTPAEIRANRAVRQAYLGEETSDFVGGADA